MRIEIIYLLKYTLEYAITVTKETPSIMIFKFKPRTLLNAMISKKKEENREVYAEKCIKQDEREI